MVWLAAFSVACYFALDFNLVSLNLNNPANLFDYYRAGQGVNFLVSIGLIAWFVARMSNTRRQRDERAVALGVQATTVVREIGTPLSAIATLTEELRDVARYDADLKMLEEQMTQCTSALARLRSRASGPAARESVAT